jgi:hypothetical protein
MPFNNVGAKMADSTPSKSLRKFQDVFRIPAFQLINQSGICKLISNNDIKILLISADHWLSLLP